MLIAKKFGKQSNHFFSVKISHRDTISLTKDGKTLTEDLQIAEIFNNYFNNVIPRLCDRNVPTEPGIACSQNLISIEINKFKNLPSILWKKQLKKLSCTLYKIISTTHCQICSNQTVSKMQKWRLYLKRMINLTKSITDL